MKANQRYKHVLAQKVHDSQQAFGLEKYGIPLDEVPTEQYDWQLMALEESVDMNQYLVREVRRLQDEVRYWKNYSMHKAKQSVLGSKETVTVEQAKAMMAHGIFD